MDLRMPELDGVSAITRLTDSGSRARVLVLTTYDTDGDVLSAIEAGATRLPAQGLPAHRAVSGGARVARGEAFDRGLLVPRNQG